MPKLRTALVFLPLSPVFAGELPHDSPARIEWEQSDGALRLVYDGRTILEGVAKGATLDSATAGADIVEQRITLHREDSITGWSSWWAFIRGCSQKDCDAPLSVRKEKRLAGFIQLDDCLGGFATCGANLSDRFEKLRLHLSRSRDLARSRGAC